MEVTFPSDVHFEVKLVSSPNAQDEKKSPPPPISIAYLLFVWVTLLSCTLSFSCMTHVCFFFSSNLLPTPHLLCSLSEIWTWYTRSFPSLYLPPSLSPSPPHPRLSANTLLSCVSSPAIRFFLISDFLSDWQISIISENLHKSLLSHFLAEMAFLPICTDSDHMEHPMHTALIPIFSTDTVKEGEWFGEWGSSHL